MKRHRFAVTTNPRLSTRSRVLALTTFLGAISLCFAATVAPGSGVGPSASAAQAPMCNTSSLRQAVSTSQQSYGSGVKVALRSSLQNTSTQICSVAIGPTSPSLSVKNAKGVVVWNNCYAGDRPAACALYLEAQTLKPGDTYVKDALWDQRSGRQRSLVAAGTYHFISQYSGISSSPSASFTITAKASPRSTTITQADSGRTYVLRQGDRLYVQLLGPTMYTWSSPISSNESVLRRSTGNSGSVATATFIAASLGRARVSAVDNPNCYPQCLPPSRLFNVTVSVVN